MTTAAAPALDVVPDALDATEALREVAGADEAALRNDVEGSVELERGVLPAAMRLMSEGAMVLVEASAVESSPHPLTAVVTAAARAIAATPRGARWRPASPRRAVAPSSGRAAAGVGASGMLGPSVGGEAAPGASPATPRVSPARRVSHPIATVSFSSGFRGLCTSAHRRRSHRFGRPPPARYIGRTNDRRLLHSASGWM